MMTAYILRRLLLVIPTLFGIISINFVVVQFAPGGPVEQMISDIKGKGGDATMRMTGTGAESISAAPPQDGAYRGARGLDPAIVKDIERMFGFDNNMMLSDDLRFEDQLDGFFGSPERYTWRIVARRPLVVLGNREVSDNAQTHTSSDLHVQASWMLGTTTKAPSVVRWNGLSRGRGTNQPSWQ